MKKLVFALVMVLLMALAACAGGTTPTTDAPVDTSEVTAPEVPAEEITVTEEPAAEEPAAEEPAAEEPAAEEPATTDETAATGAGVSLTGVEVSPPINAGDTIQAVDADASPAATPDLSGGPYWLQTMFLEGENKCLDGNQVADDAPLGGAAYMNDCSDAAGMLWTIVPDAEAGYYSLQTQSPEGASLCLEGNNLAEGADLNGGAFMKECEAATGQTWRFVESEVAGYYRLQTYPVGEVNKCLEGNRLAAESVLAGAAFRDNCLNVSGQLWKIVTPGEATATGETAEEPAAAEEPATTTEEGATTFAHVSWTGGQASAAIDLVQGVQAVDVSTAEPATMEFGDGYYWLQTRFLESQNKCLDGNEIVDGAVLDGAAYMNDCSEAGGMLWKFVPTANGFYQFQTQSLEGAGKCLEGNETVETSVLQGAAFMDDCSAVTGQEWQFVESEVEGYYRLQTAFKAPENMCLEGNRLAEESVLAGGAFQDNCLNVTGQLWKIVPFDEAAAPAEMMPIRGTGRVIGVNKPGDAAFDAFTPAAGDRLETGWYTPIADDSEVGVVAGERYNVLIITQPNNNNAQAFIIWEVEDPATESALTYIQSEIAVMVDGSEGRQLRRGDNVEFDIQPNTAVPNASAGSLDVTMDDFVNGNTAGLFSFFTE